MELERELQRAPTTSHLGIYNEQSTEIAFENLFSQANPDEYYSDYYKKYLKYKQKYLHNN